MNIDVCSILSSSTTSQYQASFVKLSLWSSTPSDSNSNNSNSNKALLEQQRIYRETLIALGELYLGLALLRLRGQSYVKGNLIAPSISSPLYLSIYLSSISFLLNNTNDIYLHIGYTIGAYYLRKSWKCYEPLQAVIDQERDSNILGRLNFGIGFFHLGRTYLIIDGRRRCISLLLLLFKTLLCWIHI